MTKTATKPQPFSRDEDRFLERLEDHWRTQAAISQSLQGGIKTTVLMSPGEARAVARCIAQGRRADAVTPRVRFVFQVSWVMTAFHCAMALLCVSLAVLT